MTMPLPGVRFNYLSYRNMAFYKFWYGRGRGTEPPVHEWHIYFETDASPTELYPWRQQDHQISNPDLLLFELAPQLTELMVHMALVFIFKFHFESQDTELLKAVCFAGRQVLCVRQRPANFGIPTWLHVLPPGRGIEASRCQVVMVSARELNCIEWNRCAISSVHIITYIDCFQLIDTLPKILAPYLIEVVPFKTIIYISLQRPSLFLPSKVLDHAYIGKLHTLL